MTNAENLVVTVTLTQNDYAKALKALGTAKANLAKTILFWISIVILAYMLYSLFSTSDNWLYPVAFTVGFFAIIVVPLKYAVPYWAARSFVKKNADKLGPSRHEVSPEGTSFQSIHGEGRQSWTAFHQIRETPDFFLLYTQSNFAQIVPKRRFASSDEIGRYREIVRKYYQGKTDLQNKP